MKDDQTETFAGIGTAQLVDSDSLDADESDNESGGYLVHGIALGINDVTVGESGKKKLWPAEELEEAAKTLEGRDLVRRHENNEWGVIGEITEAGFIEDIGVVYEAEIAPHYEELAKDVQAGLLEVSVRAYHKKEEYLEEDDETGALVVEDIFFDNLSLVRRGASPSNTAEPGSIDTTFDSVAEADAAAMVGDEYAVATLNRTIDTEPTDVVTAYEELLDVPEWEEGDMVEWQINSDMFGEIVHNPESQPFVMVDVHQYTDDGHESTGHTLTAGYSDIQMYESDENMENMSEEENSKHGDAPEGVYVAEDGTWLAVGPDEHPDDSTEHPDDGKYPITSCTGKDSVDSAWHLREHGDIDITEETLEERLMRAAKEMDCNPDVLDMDSFEENSKRDSTFEDEQLASMNELDEVYSEWDDHVNMTASELETWSDNPCSTEASVDPEAVIERNMNLLETNKSEWGTDEIEDAKRTISFISRMSAEENEPDEPMDGPNGCPSEWAISLLNWAYNPFDSVPSVPDEMQEENAEHDDVFESESDAVARSEELGLGGAVHEHAFEDYDGTYYMPGEDMDDYRSAMSEMSEEEQTQTEPTTHTVATVVQDSKQRAVLNNNDTTMDELEYSSADTDDIEDQMDNPVVVEREELESTRERAEQAESVDAEIEELSQKLDEQSEAEEVIAELSDDEVDLIESDTDATVVSVAEAEMLSEVREVYAEELAEHSVFDAEDIAEKFSPTELRERVEENDDITIGDELSEPDQEPSGGHEEPGDPSGGQGPTEEELREEYARELEDKGWDEQAAKVRNGRLDPVNFNAE